MAASRLSGSTSGSAGSTSYHQDRDVTAHQNVRRDVAVLVPAAGQGTRLGAGVPKALHPLDGAALLVHALRRLIRARSVGEVVVATPPDHMITVRDLLAADGLTDVRLVPGGASRRESVAAALAEASSGFPIVLVHDAARAFAPPELVERVAAAIRAGHDAVIPVLPVVDTVKRVDHTEHVVATPARSELRAVQTPQGFRRAVLEAAHALPGGDGTATDDAGLVERLGARVFCVPGEESAMKITTPSDLAVARALRWASR
jgi:2-C-methyl-D-erythritol 4-phosphate cytidylyltransferase